ncbi:chemotaxis protein [Photobacterium proteolyticum]|uniref:Chemotaxis protein n=1 Tax=Photobacterium proteolyticum TaxID=1903952 RepID=A0A1Q9G637_9GAMM|nr:methyl-accepting chemotaxis protein [Photobacterium proteolyticum]OLQ69431.1 chemotaxis protein [Photobacterium proteolyticum]
MKLQQQLISGFGLLIVLLLALSISSFFRFSTTLDGFVEYRGLAISSVSSGRIQANILEARLAASKYIKNQSEDLKQAINNRIDIAMGLLDQELAAELEPELRRRFQDIKTGVENYQQGFDQVETLIEERHQTVENRLDPNGLTMRKMLTDIAHTAYDDGDLEAAFYSGELQESVMLARLYVTKYLVSNDAADKERALLEFDNIKRRAGELINQIQNPKRIELFGSFEKSFSAYRVAFNDTSDIIEKRNNLVAEVLDVVGRESAASIEEIKLEAKKHQDEIGPALQSDIINTKYILTILSIVSVIIGLLSALYIYKGVMRVVGGEPSQIAEMVKKVSEGDLTSDFTVSGKETGIYANTIAMHRELKRIIAGFHSISDNVSSASVELTAVMAESKANSEQELAQVEQVATAVNELSSTAAEVSANAASAEEAANVAGRNVADGQQALQRSDKISEPINSSVQESTQIVNQLKDYSNEIGSVVDVINGISEQTNLLALNAAIEAARAGEQGRGFAVVADEVRSLAAKTQQSTIDIQEIISQLQSQAQKADDFMQSNAELIAESLVITQQVGEAFSSISSSVAQISELNTLVATASEEQSGVTKEISENVETTSEIVHQNVSGITQSSHASEELSRLSEEQKSLLAYFKV